MSRRSAQLRPGSAGGSSQAHCDGAARCCVVFMLHRWGWWELPSTELFSGATARRIDNVDQEQCALFELHSPGAFWGIWREVCGRPGGHWVPRQQGADLRSGVEPFRDAGSGRPRRKGATLQCKVLTRLMAQSLISACLLANPTCVVHGRVLCFSHDQSMLHVCQHGHNMPSCHSLMLLNIAGPH